MTERFIVHSRIKIMSSRFGCHGNDYILVTETGYLYASHIKIIPYQSEPGFVDSNLDAHVQYV